MTPTALIEELDAVLPGFADYLRGADSLYAASDGTFSVHGVFSEFSVYLRDRYSTLPLHSARRLGVFLTRCFDDAFGDTVSNAVATCCLENLAGDTLHAALAKNLGDAARRFYNGVVGL
jgi:hypothetical protein